MEQNIESLFDQKEETCSENKTIIKWIDYEKLTFNDKKRNT